MTADQIFKKDRRFEIQAIRLAGCRITTNLMPTDPHLIPELMSRQKRIRYLAAQK